MYLWIFLLFLIVVWTEIKLLYFVLTLIILVAVIWTALRDRNYVVLAFAGLVGLFLLPSLLFYLELCYLVYPYLFSVRGKRVEMKNDCNRFLHRHFHVNKINEHPIDTPVIYLVNHHTSDSKILDYFGTLTIPGKNSIVVTSGETRWEIIDNLYSNLDTVKLERSSGGNLENFLKNCTAELQQGHNLIIFPEGKFTNKKTHWRQLVNLQTGAFILSQQNNIPIIPVLISGNTHQYGFITNDYLTVKYLEPILPEDFTTPEQMRDAALHQMNQNLKLI